MLPIPQYLSPLTRTMGILPSAGKRPAVEVHPTQNLKRFAQILAAQPKPHILDLGSTSSPNIDWFIHLGFRVSVDDRTSPFITLPEPLLEDREEEDKTASSLLLQALEYPPKSFDGILCWDIFDYLATDQDQAFLSNLQGILKPEGLLLAFFNFNRHAPPPPTRYRILGEDQLEYQPLNINTIPRRAYENREIQDLFSELTLINSCFLKNQMREILVQKK